MKSPALLWMIAAALVSPACSHHAALLASYNTYSPPALALAPVSASLPPVAKVKQPSAAASRTVSQMAQMRHRWDDSLKPDGKNSNRFYTPSPKRLVALKPAATDATVAARALSGDFTLETLEILTLLRNPEVIAAENTFRGKLNAYDQVTNLDDILQQYSAYTQSVMPGVGTPQGAASPDMKFPFPGVTALKGEIVQQEVRIAREALETARRTAVTSARNVYWNLCYNYSALAITRSTLDLIRQLGLSARKRYEVGKGMLQDMVQPRIQQAVLEERLQTLRETDETLQSDIRSIANLPPETKIGAPYRQEPRRDLPPLKTLLPLAMKNRQELKTARAMVSRAERMIELGETETYPRFTQNLSLFENKAVTQVGSFRTEEPFAVVAEASMGQGLPQNPWFGFNNAYLQETRDNLEALRRNLINIENNTRYRVREGRFKLAQALRGETLYAGAIAGLSKLSGETVRQRYESGIAGMRDVIDAYMAWLEARLAGERSRSDIGIARASLEAVVGKSW